MDYFSKICPTVIRVASGSKDFVAEAFIGFEKMVDEHCGCVLKE
jgi:hypothetical protein